MGTLLAFGEIMLRLSPPGRELLLQTPKLDVWVAGAEANVATALARLGHDVRFASRVPDNDLGRSAIATLRGHGVDTRGIALGGARMGLYFVTSGAGMRATEVIYDRAHSAFAEAPVAGWDWDALLDGVDGLHLSGITPALGERDLPIGIVALVSLATLVPIAGLLWSVIARGPLAGSAVVLIAGALVFVLVLGLVIAAVCGYMAGLIGASNSPVSGIGILSVLAASLMLVGLFGRGAGADTTQALVAYALIVTGIVFGVATISNDNLQDLKTGQLVGATPWKQQVALIFGVIFGSLVVPPVLELLATTLGFQGAPGAGPNALAAPQAALISALAKGVLGGNLNWVMIGYGALIGVGVIALDETLGRTGKLRLPPLGVGLGVYLPMAVTLPVVLGAVIGALYDRWADRTPDVEFAKRMGVLTATGMIVGESLWGVAFAVIVYVTGSDAPLAIAPAGFDTIALVGGTIAFLALVAGLYRLTRRSVTQP